MKQIGLCVLTTAIVFLVGCSPSFKGEDLNRAKALIKTNMLCSIMVKYRVGQVSVLAMDSEKHDRLVARLQASSDDYLVGDFRGRLDTAFFDDLEKVFKRSDSDTYEGYVAEIYDKLQAGMQENHGYSYPDCDVAIAMSESLLEKNSSYW